MAVTQTITVTKTKTLAQPWKNLVTMPVEEQIIDQDIGKSCPSTLLPLSRVA